LLRPIATGRVAWSFGLSVTTISPAKTAETIDMPFGMWTWVGPRDYVLDDESRSPNGNRHFWGDDVAIFLHTTSTIPSGPDVGISPHAIDQRSYWLATEAVECHIKFSQWKIPCDAASLSKFFDHLLLFNQTLLPWHIH